MKQRCHLNDIIYTETAMRGSRKFYQSGSKFDKLNVFFILVDEGIEEPNITMNGPLSTTSKTPFKWRFAGGPMMAQYCMLAWYLYDFSGYPDQYF